jgi:hypothetical protein
MPVTKEGKLERFEWTAGATIQTESGKRWVLNYFIHIIENNTDMPIYGLRVEKCNENGQLSEAETTPPFTDSYKEAVGLSKKLAQGGVPPCTLLEMVDELSEFNVSSPYTVPVAVC